MSTSDHVAVVPVWAIALGSLLLAERVGWRLMFGGALVITGIVLSRTKASRLRTGDP